MYRPTAQQEKMNLYFYYELDTITEEYSSLQPESKELLHSKKNSLSYSFLNAICTQVSIYHITRNYCYPIHTMKRFLSACLLFVISISLQPALLLPHAQAATINATLSDTVFTPGKVITLEGNNFGSQPSRPQICFGQSICSTTASFNSIVSSWNNTAITILVPYANIPSNGTVFVYSGNDTIQTNQFTYDQTKPEVLSVSPLEVTPEESIITITGRNLRNYSSGSGVCINNGCIMSSYLSNYVVSWSDSSIQLKLPYIANTSTFSLFLEIPIYTTVSGNLIKETISLPGFSYKTGSNPSISSISPQNVIPGQTIVRITGTGFENAYKPGWHSLCFNNMCLNDESARQYILSWSDSEIQFIVPKEFSIANQLTTSLYLKFPSEGAYKPLDAPNTLVLQVLPTVDRYTQDSTTGGGVLFIGRNFGSDAGTVRINGEPLPIINWADTRIEAYIPLHVRSGDAVIQTKDGRESIGVPMRVASANTYSSDLYSAEQWQIPLMRIREAWQKANLSRPITVAVLDSGVDFNHQDMRGSSWINTGEIAGNGIDDDGNGFIDDVYGWNFVTNSNNTTPVHEHGTMVASVIAAAKDNLMGFAGAAPNARIMSLVVAEPSKDGSDPTIPFDAAQRAIKYAVDNGAKIINLSFSGATPSPLYRDVLDYAYKHNVLVVAASGNTSTNLKVQPHSPICDDSQHNEVIGVASIGKTGWMSSFANYGACIDMVAPGEDIFVAVPSSNNNDYGYASGTSFATPLVAGIAALLWSLHPDWNVEEIKTVLLSSTELRNGFPLLNAEKALSSSRPTVSYTPAPNAKLELKNNDTVIQLETPVIAPIQDGTPIPSTSDAPIFPDVPNTYVHATAIRYLADRGIIEGYPTGIFAPGRNINRAEFLKLILEARGFAPSSAYANCFSDVKTDWYAPYVCYAKQQGYIEGYPDTTRARSEWAFRPDQTINKVEALKILLNVFDIQTGSTTTSYRDVSPSAWYAGYVSKAENLGLLMETGLLLPGEYMTRGKISEITYRLLYLREKNLPRFGIL